MFITSLCFSDRSEDQDGCPGLWLAETFFDFSATIERNLMRLDSKQDLNILYQVCVFGAILKAKMAHPLPSLWFSDWSYSEQDKSFNIEHQPPFGDHYTLPQMRGGGYKNKQENHIILTKYEAVHIKAVSENYSACVPFIMLVLRCTNVAFWFFLQLCRAFATNLQLTLWRRVSFGICVSNLRLSCW